MALAVVADEPALGPAMAGVLAAPEEADGVAAIADADEGVADAPINTKQARTIQVVRQQAESLNADLQACGVSTNRQSGNHDFGHGCLIPTLRLVVPRTDLEH